MISIPLAWSQYDIIEKDCLSTSSLSSSHEHYDPAPPRPYDPLPPRPYDPRPPQPYQPINSVAFQTSSDSLIKANDCLPTTMQKKTQIRQECFGASVCTSLGLPFKINHAALKFIVELTEHNISNDQLQGYILKHYPRIRQHVSDLLDKCRKYGWTDAPFNWKNVGTSSIPKDILVAPYTVFLFPSLECNLENTCSKCFVHLSNRIYRDKMLLPSDLKPTLRRLEEMGVFNLIILGGEPLAYSHLHALLKLATSFSFNVSLSTNGLLITDKSAVTLSNYVDRVQVSIDGAYTESAEQLKGRGTFLPSINAIKNLVANDISVTASYVLTKKNSGNQELLDFVNYMLDLGVTHISFIQYYPVGEVSDNSLMLEASDNSRIRIKLNQIKRKFTEVMITFEDTFAFLDTPCPPNTFTPLETTTLGCHCGRTRVSIYPNGDVIPCDFLANIEEFKSGNIYQDDMEELWNKSPVLKTFRQREVVDVEPCNSCGYRFLCRGACQAMAWQVSKRLDMPDPRCPLVQERERTLE